MVSEAPSSFGRPKEFRSREPIRLALLICLLGRYRARCLTVRLHWVGTGRVASRYVSPYPPLSRTLKVRGGIISQANRYLGGFCFSQRIFPPQIIQVLPTMRGVLSKPPWIFNLVPLRSI